MTAQTDEELLWDYLLNEQTITIGQFAASIIGLGALFFAFGQVTIPILRLTISAVGMAAGLIFWTHIWGAGKNQFEIRKNIALTRPTLMNRFNELRRWQTEERPYKWLYKGVLKLMVYFAGLMVLAWFSLFLYAAGVPAEPTLYVLDSLGLFTAVVLWFVLPNRPGRRQTLTGPAPSSSNETSGSDPGRH